MTLSDGVLSLRQSLLELKLRELGNDGNEDVEWDEYLLG
jgi:hypothetical protein